MKLLNLFLLLLLFDVAVAQNNVYNLPAITSTGGAPTLAPAQSPQIIYVNTGGSNVNMGSNSYTLAYTSQPPTGTGFFLYFDATQLTAMASHVTLFGYQPLVTVPGLGFYRLRYDFNGNTITVTCYTDQSTANNVINRVTFLAPVYMQDSLKIYGPLEAHLPGLVQAGQAVVSLSDSGNLGFGCTPWCTAGNAGLNGSVNFLGTTDTATLSFRVNNQPFGFLSYNSGNVALGLNGLLQNTTGDGNVSLGINTLFANTVGQFNVAVGANSLNSSTMGQENTAVGHEALNNSTTGNNNVAIGSLAQTATPTVSNATILGSNSSAADHAIALGVGVAAPINSMAVSNTVDSIGFLGMTSGQQYVLMDVNGDNYFTPQPLFGTTQTYFTPVTGDSITPFTGSNLVNPAGTLANLTIRVPGHPAPGQIMEFSFTQIVSALHWSVALNQGNAVAPTVPTAVAAGATVKIQYNVNTGTWFNY